MSTSHSDAVAAVPAGQPREVSVLDLALVILRHRLLVFGLPSAVAAAALAVSFLMPLKFTANAQMLLPQQQQSGAAALLGSLGGLAGAAAGAALKNPADQWIGFLKSRTVQDAMIERFHLRERYEAEYLFQARNTLGGSSVFTSGKDGMIDIAVTDREPKMAADMANAYIEELQKLSKTLAVSEAAQRRVFFEGQLKDAKDNLIKAETALRSSGINESALKTTPEAAVTALAQLRAQVTAAEVKVSVMRGQVTQTNPEFQVALSELSSLRDQLARVERNDSSASQKSGAEYISRYRDFKYYETLFELMARQYELAKSDEAKDGALIQVVDAALIPEWKSGPKRGLITVLTFMMTLTFTVIYVLLREAARNAARQNAAIAGKFQQLRQLLRPGRSATP